MVRAHERESSRRLARLPSGHGPWWVAHPARPALRLEWEGGGSAVVLVAGNVDVATAPQLEAFVATRPLTDCAVLELDLADVLSMGSVGLSALLSLRR